MSRLTLFNSPLFLGFEDLERLLDRMSKASADGYPPYNIEEVDETGIRITLAVAGFARADLAVTVEDNQLVIRGKRPEDEANRTFLHRGIAARQFLRSFVIAEGIEVAGAELANGLLTITLRRPKPTELVQRIEITEADSAPREGQAERPGARPRLVAKPAEG